MKPANYPSASDQDEQLAVIRRNINVSSFGIIHGIMGSRIVDSLPLRVRCECAVPICEEIIEITLGKRRELRRQYARGFIVVLAHTTSALNGTLYQSSNYSIVEKKGFTETVVDL